MNRLFAFMISAVCAVGGSSGLHAQTDVPIEQVPALIAAHVKSREAIRNFSCKIHFALSYKTDDGKTRTIDRRGQYWHSGPALRLKVTEVAETTHDNEYVWNNGIRLSLVNQKYKDGSNLSASKQKVPKRYCDPCDVYTRTLMAIGPPGSFVALPLEEFQNEASGLEKVFSTTNGNQTLTTLRFVFYAKEADDDDKRMDLVLDSTINNLVRKTIYYFGGTTPEKSLYWREEVVEKVLELRPGVLFPVEIVGTENQGSKDQRASITELKIDQTFTPTTFELKLPHGISLSDEFLGSSYVVDTNGKAIGTTTFKHTTLEPKLTERMASQTPVAESPTEESSEMPNYFLYVAIALGVCAAGLYLRSRTASSTSERT